MKVWNYLAPVCMALGVTHCATPGRDTSTITYGEAGEEPQVDIMLENDDAIVNDPADYVGKTVRVEGSVKGFVGSKGVTMDLDGLIGQDKVLVINDTGEPMILSKGEKVQVTGPLELFVTADIESKIKNDLVDQVFIDYTNKPVVIAKTLTKYE